MKGIAMLMLAAMLVSCGQQTAVERPQAEITHYVLDTSSAYKWVLNGTMKNTGTLHVQYALIEMTFINRTGKDKYTQLASAVVSDIAPNQEKDFQILVTTPPPYTDKETYTLEITDIR
jgi:hypothetical protein